jgi:hypothetical protein
MTSPDELADVRAQVRARYAGAAATVMAGGIPACGGSDLIAEDHLTSAERIERGRPAGAIAGALSFAEYRVGLARAGFTGITISPAYQVADGLHSVIVRAARP